MEVNQIFLQLHLFFIDLFFLFLFLGYVLESGRVNGVLAVARAFGDFYIKDPEICADPEVNIVSTNDWKFLIIACDG